MNEFGQPIGEPVDWQGARSPGRAILEGRSVRLEPLAAGHAEAIAANLGGEANEPLWTYRLDYPPLDTSEAAQRLAHGASEANHLTFAIIPTASGETEGMASLMRINPAEGSIEVGSIIYATTLQRTRAATEAMYLMARHVFEDLGYRRYEWKCDSLNAPSRAAATRLGFVEEGTFRNELVYKGRNRDTTWFSITDSEWPAVAAALASWLADDNFDETGHQRRSLAQLR